MSDYRQRTAVQTMKASSKNAKQMGKIGKSEVKGKRSMSSEKEVDDKIRSSRERKIALEQDVHKLRKKLRHEENVHRALERAFTRPLGSLPRLPSYLPSETLELLAEVAVLEEEVVWLEEQLINFRKGLYHEAIYISSSKKTKENESDLVGNMPSSMPKLFSEENCSRPSVNHSAHGKVFKENLSSSVPSSEHWQDKENPLKCRLRNTKLTSAKKVPAIKPSTQDIKQADKLRHCKMLGRVETTSRGALNRMALQEASGPNRISEDILKCLMNIFLRMSSVKIIEDETESSPSVSGSCDSYEETEFQDPFSIDKEFSWRDVGPYKHFRAIELKSIYPNLLKESSFLTRRLKNLLRKLSLVDLSDLTHQQKLAFWINIYNSCMMNAFLEQGIPSNPEMLVALMSKAMINVGGHLLSAMTIEQFILRLPYNSQYGFPKGPKVDQLTMRSIIGLEWPEPLVTFALSCGTWSSPAVRVYTPEQVENKLESAKRDYLQAAVCISMPDKLAIPKLLDWYLLDFAKDVESLMDWICLQLPNKLRAEAIKCLEVAKGGPIQRPIQVLPYEFRFRYLLAP